MKEIKVTRSQKTGKTKGKIKANGGKFDERDRLGGTNCELC